MLMGMKLVQVPPAAMATPLLCPLASHLAAAMGMSGMGTDATRHMACLKENLGLPGPSSSFVKLVVAKFEQPQQWVPGLPGPSPVWLEETKGTPHLQEQPGLPVPSRTHVKFLVAKFELMVPGLPGRLLLLDKPVGLAHVVSQVSNCSLLLSGTLASSLALAQAGRCFVPGAQLPPWPGWWSSAQWSPRRRTGSSVTWLCLAPWCGLRATACCRAVGILQLFLCLWWRGHRVLSPVA